MTKNAIDKLILFDIDGTLTASPVGHVEAHAVAYQKVFDVYGSIYMTEYDGRTDRQITKQVLTGLGFDDSEIERKLPEFMQVMGDYYASLKPYLRPKLLPGVVATLDNLASGSDIMMGNVTGNLEQIAKDKLAVAGIGRYFEVGGYGSESDERARLVELAIERARAHGFVGDDVYVVGDTPADIRAGTQAGVKTIGVATGAYSQEELQEAGATRTLPNLASSDLLREALGW